MAPNENTTCNKEEIHVVLPVPGPTSFGFLRRLSTRSANEIAAESSESFFRSQNSDTSEDNQQADGDDVDGDLVCRKQNNDKNQKSEYNCDFQ